MKIDACVFLGDSLYGNSIGPDQLIDELEKNGVDVAIIRPFKPSDYNYDRANQYIANVQNQYTNLYGFGRVNPWEKNAPQQVEMIYSYGLKGLHLHPWEDNFPINDPVVYPTIRMAEKYKLPVYVSTGYPNVSEPLQLWEMAMAFTGVTFIATHGGQLDMSGLSFDEALAASERAKNIMFDLSGVYRRDFIELLIKTAGEESVIFGSCVPYMDMSLEIERIQAAQISEEQKNKIFAENIRKLISI